MLKHTPDSLDTQGCTRSTINQNKPLFHRAAVFLRSGLMRNLLVDLYRRYVQLFKCCARIVCTNFKHYYSSDRLKAAMLSGQRVRLCSRACSQHKYIYIYTYIHCAQTYFNNEITDTHHTSNFAIDTDSRVTLVWALVLCSSVCV